MKKSKNKQLSKNTITEILSAYQDEISPKTAEERIKSWFDRNTIEGEWIEPIFFLFNFPLMRDNGDIWWPLSNGDAIVITAPFATWEGKKAREAIWLRNAFEIG